MWKNILQIWSNTWQYIPKKLPLHSSLAWFQFFVYQARRSETGTFFPSIVSSLLVNCALEFTLMFPPPANNVTHITPLFFFIWCMGLFISTSVTCFPLWHTATSVLAYMELGIQGSDIPGQCVPPCWSLLQVKQLVTLGYQAVNQDLETTRFNRLLDSWAE